MTARAGTWHDYVMTVEGQEYDFSKGQEWQVYGSGFLVIAATANDGQTYTLMLDPQALGNDELTDTSMLLWRQPGLVTSYDQFDWEVATLAGICNFTGGKLTSIDETELGPIAFRPSSTGVEFAAYFAVALLGAAVGFATGRASNS